MHVQQNVTKSLYMFLMISSPIIRSAILYIQLRECVIHVRWRDVTLVPSRARYYAANKPLWHIPESVCTVLDSWWWTESHPKHIERYFNIFMGSVLREANLITVQQDATYSVYYISVGSSTCFEWWHQSAGARTAVITASGAGQPGLLTSTLVVELYQLLIVNVITRNT